MCSLNDQKVLKFMFDPFLLESENVEEEEEIESKEVIIDKNGDNNIEYLQRMSAKNLEIEAIKLANQKTELLDEALVKLEEAIGLWPEKASIYNNRAQVYRLKNRIEGKVESLVKTSN